MTRFATMLLATIALIWAGVAPSAEPPRGAADRSDLIEVVLCAEGAAGSSVWLDEAGQPVDPDQTCKQSHCPACIAVPDADLRNAPTVTAPFRAHLLRSVEFAVLLPIPLRWHAPMPHGPPSKRAA